MKDENLYDKIREIIGDESENFSILDAQIDVNTQMNYFEISKTIRENPPERKETLSKENILFDESVDIEEKKELLVALAGIDKAIAYRIIERFSDKVPESLKDWTLLALQESKLTLESSFLDEKKMVISTGLGGKDKKLRYFIAFSQLNSEPFTELQAKLFSKELEFAIKNSDGEIELIEFEKEFGRAILLAPITILIRDVISSVIEECNQIGNFVSYKFILTNVKLYSFFEIRGSWEN